jgi:L-threonylcarbamoyladenylate synthase
MKNQRKSMSVPNFVIKRAERTAGGSLSTSNVQQIRAYLLRNGYILLPSDTCYSVATLANVKSAYNNINTLLKRKKQPISLSFPNFAKVEEWIELNMVISVLLESFTPGPLTVVCNANSKIPVEFTTLTIGSSLRTIGVRIPDSIVERQVAACTKSLITTVAVRDPKTDTIVQNFEHAIKIVERGMKKIGNPGWGAIEGGEFYAKHSTVVHVTDEAEKVKLLREGDIPFGDVLSISDSIPHWTMEDWP